ncbi:zinc finger protein [Macleaya cordata]|uniref:Zinc finger protein n=1 Tax=Macleaya cordata TaxID=56857 RepID=A0A200PWU1_MACCD|nr:zinc finger protein [Macleaya cordata]
MEIQRVQLTVTIPDIPTIPNEEGKGVDCSVKKSSHFSKSSRTFFTSLLLLFAQLGMEEPNHHLPISSCSSSNTSINGCPSVSSSSSSSHSSSGQVQEEEEQNQQENHQQEQQQQEEEVQHHQEQQHQASSSRGVNIGMRDALSSDMRDDSWSCLVMLVTFWFFASMTLILGFYGPVNLEVGPNCSRLLEANSYFINKIKVEQLGGPAKGLMLYGFHSPPPLDVETTWSETHNEWIFFLNEGSEINITYSVKSPSTLLFLVIAAGKESLIEWTENPSYPNITLSWNVINGTGAVQQKIYMSSDHYVAVGNLNPNEVEVQVNLTIQALMYNTTEAYYKCSLTNGPCASRLSFLGTDVAALTSSGPKQDPPSGDWYVKLWYGQRWISYLLGSGVMTILVLLVFKICVKCHSSVGPGPGYQPAVGGSERTPLLVNKDDDLSSWSSSYDSVSHDEEDLEDSIAVDSLEGKQLKDGENSNPRRLCVICYDAPRDCFFLPCGHCATCFTCGTRIAEEAGICPICRRKMKKVRKIFAV